MNIICIYIYCVCVCVTKREIIMPIVGGGQQKHYCCCTWDVHTPFKISRARARVCECIKAQVSPRVGSPATARLRRRRRRTPVVRDSATLFKFDSPRTFAELLPHPARIKTTIIYILDDDCV